MMRSLTILILFLLAAPAMAQDRTCNNGLPCGPIPWPLPIFPDLVSPSPMPTAVATATPTITHTPTATPTLTATTTATATLDPSVSPTLTSTSTPTTTPTSDASSTPLLNTSGVEEAIGTIQAFNDATQVGVMINGTPSDVTTEFSLLGANAGTVFGYIRGLQSANVLGKATPFFTFTFVTLLTVMSVKAMTFVGPIIAALVGLIRKAVSLILDFLPL
jgi:hypothetical protein